MSDTPSIVRRIVAPPPPALIGLHLLVGPSTIQSLVLFSLARDLHAGRQVFWIDAGNWFDAYGLAKVSRAAQLDERRVLANVHVARPFTAIQLNRMLAKQLPRVPSSCPVIVSDPMALFYDHEMPERDVSRIFREFIRVIRRLAVPVLGLAVTRTVPEARRELSKRLLREVGTVARLRNTPEPLPLS